MNPLVDIIIVNYNGLADTVECVESLKKCRYDNFEIIIVDNCSTDDSYDNLNYKYSSENNIYIIKSNINNGFATGNNLGIDLAKYHHANYCVLVNNDTIVDPDFLTPLVEFAEKANTPIILTGKILYYYDKKRIWYGGGFFDKYKGTGVHLHGNELDDPQDDQIRSCNFICGCLLFMSLNVVDIIGPLPEEYFLYGEDTDYSLNALKHNIPMFYIPNSIIYHKVSASTKKLSNFSYYYMLRNRFYVISKYEKGLYKISAYAFSMLSIAKGIIKKEYPIRIVRKALKDFNKDNMGMIVVNLNEREK